MADPLASTDWLNHIWSILGGGILVQGLNLLSSRRKTSAEIKQMESQADSALEAIVSERIKNLLEHYDKRVEDLLAEVHGLRKEVTELRKALDARPIPVPLGFGI